MPLSCIEYDSIYRLRLKLVTLLQLDEISLRYYYLKLFFRLYDDAVARCMLYIMGFILVYKPLVDAALWQGDRCVFIVN